MANARQSRGRRTNVVVANWLASHGWPNAIPTYGSEPGKDVKNIKGFSIEVKARKNFDPLSWLKQAKSNAEANEIPVAIVRCNGQGENASDYLVIRRLEDDILNQGGIVQWVEKD